MGYISHVTSKTHLIKCKKKRPNVVLKITLFSHQILQIGPDLDKTWLCLCDTCENVQQLHYTSLPHPDLNHVHTLFLDILELMLLILILSVNKYISISMISSCLSFCPCTLTGTHTNTLRSICHSGQIHTMETGYKVFSPFRICVSALFSFIWSRLFYILPRSIQDILNNRQIESTKEMPKHTVIVILTLLIKAGMH